MRVIMTGGGTGGHIYPAVAIADEIKKREPEAEILFVGAQRGLEKKLVPQRGYNIKLIPVAGFDRKHLLKNIEVIRKLMKGNAQARKIIKDFQPDFVVGTGGYASAPLVKAAQKLKIPSYIHEQNAYAGVTNKLLEKGARKIFLGFGKAAENFRCKDKIVVVGNPVRDEFISASREEARKKLGFSDDEFVLLAFGGSQGAGRINKAMLNVIREFNGRQDMRICLGAGSYYYSAIMASLKDEGFQPADNISIMEYIQDMASYLAAADLIITRSGALTVAEATVCGAPAIFIPSPMVTGNHQYFTALAVAEKGGAIILEEKDLQDQELIDRILEIKGNPDMLKKMSAASRQCSHANSTETICDIIWEDCLCQRETGKQKQQK